MRLKQQIELLPAKYKDEETFEKTRESPLTRNGPDVFASPKVASTQPRSIADRYRSASQNISSASSADSSPKSVKQISSMKITVLDSNARKVNSPIGRKQVIASKFPENHDSDNTVAQQEVVSPKNNKSVLKAASGSVGSLIKKKVIFDLEDGKNEATVPGNDLGRKSQVNNSEWSISNFSEARDYTLQKEKSMSTGNIILKTSQSDKIAEISKKIQEQVNVCSINIDRRLVESIRLSSIEDNSEFPFS